MQSNGLSRDTFYRYKSAVDEGSIDDQNRRKPNLKNRVDETIETAIKDYAIAFPPHGQHRTSNELGKQGVFVSGSGVRSVWLRYQLANFKDRLKALEVKVAELTDAQARLLSAKNMMTRHVARLNSSSWLLRITKYLLCRDI